MHPFFFHFLLFSIRVNLILIKISAEKTDGELYEYVRVSVCLYLYVFAEQNTQV